MKTDCFDAVVDFSPVDKEKLLDALFLIQRIKIPCSFYFYPEELKGERHHFFVRVNSHRPLVLKWKDKFEVMRPRGRRLLGKGLVLNPFSEKLSRKRIKRRIDFLEGLQGGKKEMLLALVKEKGIQGLREKEIIDFSSLSKRSLLRLAQELEAEGKIKILSFTPLFLLFHDSLDFLCKKVLAFLAHFHKRHPEDAGVSLDRIKKRFDLYPRILTLALKHLTYTGEIKELDSKIALSGIEVTLTPEEENILQEMESMCFKGEFCSFSLKDLQNHFRLSSKKTQQMLSLLIERKKVVQGKDGLLLHSLWLDKLIKRIKESGKEELTVGDFKKMTGLTRKYAIPLLELLDQMGITRRKGASREIL